jgi:hypothetical protein
MVDVYSIYGFIWVIGILFTFGLLMSTSRRDDVSVLEWMIVVILVVVAWPIFAGLMVGGKR